MPRRLSPFLPLPPFPLPFVFSRLPPEFPADDALEFLEFLELFDCFEEERLELFELFLEAAGVFLKATAGPRDLPR